MRKSTSDKKEKNTTVTAWDSALRYLASSARTKKEMERRLDRLGYGADEIASVMDRLEESCLLNDEAFCRDFIDSRLRSKPVSRAHLREQLRAHEADENAIETTLDSVTDEIETKNAIETARKYMRQFSALPDDERRMRVYARLFSRAYGPDTIREVMEAIGSEEEKE